MQLLEVTQCRAFCAHQWYYANMQDSLWLLIIVFACLTMFFIIKKLYENDIMGFSKFPKERLNKVLSMLLIMCWAVLLGLIIYEIWFHAPAEINQMLQNISDNSSQIQTYVSPYQTFI